MATERTEANLFDNGFHVAGMGVGSIVLTEGLRRTFGKDQTIGQRVIGVLATVLGGAVTAFSGHGLVNQVPVRGDLDVIDAVIIGTIVGL